MEQRADHPAHASRRQEPSPPRRARSGLDRVERSGTEAVAIIGVGCRFPNGGDGPTSFWQLLCKGVDAICEIPPQRWDIDAYYDPDPSAPDRMYTRWGSFLDRVDEFDADFFGISPREAVRIDPQQRLLAEVTWEALEDSGRPAAEIEGTRTGVFVGIVQNDYTRIQLQSSEEIDAFAGTGCAASIAANRLSYMLNLRGPSVAVDTACSSSLIAVHLACQSLRRGESDLALAGGVNLILAPEASIALSKARMLSPDGRCKSFDSAADGYARGEGCGMVVLKRFAEALADGDSILAVVRGSAVNHDGRSNGLSAPNGPAQQEVIRAALSDAGIEPEQVGDVEAHGTGTPLGDSIEIGALLAELCGNRPVSRALLVGSVKTNIGHLEGAAGVAGLIKAALMLKFGMIPPHLHLQKPNPALAVESTPIEIPTALRPWPGEKEARYAGVSSFGFGGTNAHLVLSDAPLVPAASNPIDRTRQVLAISARTEPALRELADRLDRRLASGPPLELADVAFSANTGRTHFPYRQAVVADSVEGLRGHLKAFASGKPTPAVRSGKATGRKAPKVAFLFTGQGSQYPDMGRILFETQPTFRKILQQCEERLGDHLEQPLLSVLYPEPGADSPLSETIYTQTALFALEYALAALWRSWGIEPALVLGHSLGEYAAACVAGAFGLEDGLKLVARRARLMQALPPGSSMAAVFASEEEVTEMLAPDDDRVTIAALNGPQNVVISGEDEALREVLARLAEKRIKAKKLATSGGFHCASVEPMLDRLEQAVASVEFHEPQVQVISNLTGSRVEGRVLANPVYWRRHARQPVRFADGMQSLADCGCGVFVEIGPDPVLLGMGRRCLPQRRGAWLPSLRSGRDDWQVLLESLAELYVRGANVDWTGFDGDYHRQRVELPTYPFQRRRYWPANATVGRRHVQPVLSTTGRTLHPLLGRRLRVPIAGRLYESRLGARRPAVLADHKIQGQVVMAGAAYLEMALAAAEDCGGHLRSIEEFTLAEPLVFHAADLRTVQTVLVPENDRQMSLRIVNLAEDDDDDESAFTTHAYGRLRAESADEAGPDGQPIDVAQLRSQYTGEAFDFDWATKVLRASGFEPGPGFRWIRQHWTQDRRALGEVCRPEQVRDAEAYRVHPGLIDSVFQLLSSLIPWAATAEDACVPASVDRLRLFARPGEHAWCEATLREVDESVGRGDVRLFDDAGRLLMEIEGLRLRRVPRDWLQKILGGKKTSEKDWLYEVAWRSQTRTDAAAEDDRNQPGRWLIIGNRDGLGAALADRLEARGEDCFIAEPHAAGRETRQLVEEALSADGPALRGVIHTASLDIDGPAEDAENAAPAFDLARQRGWGSALDVIQALTAAGHPRLPGLWLVTRGAQGVPCERRRLSLAQSPLWGLARVVTAELPALRCVRIDLDPDESPDANLLFGEIWHGDGEDQVAFRKAQRYVPRMVRLGERDRASLRVPQTAARRLEITSRGGLDHVKLRPAPRRQPGPGEVEIRVRATGLNFRDVLNVLGLYPGDAGPLGGECAGEVVAIGDGVSELAVGDPVVALAAGCFSSYATTLATLVVPIPKHLSFEEAATIPIAFLTADHALRRLGGIGPGDRVLIHAASGGVGLAAVQLAQKAGAEIFATAGNPEKRRFLKSLGVPHVMDSRSLEFAQQIRQTTESRGVDLVLNSLTGESIAKSISVLAPGGRFLEIGKTDLWDQERVDQVNPGVAFHAIALDQMTADDPRAVGSSLRRLIEEFAAKRLQPLTHRVFPIDKAVDAFRYMARARHIGKIVVRAADQLAGTDQSFRLRQDATYLITGGLGGLGLKVAQWMADRGARHLVLVGRSGGSERARPLLKRLEDSGVQVVVARADVARQEDLAKLLNELETEMPPLCGVVHAAGVLDDGILAEQTRRRFDRVMAAKVLGAWNLHVLSKDRPLEVFVLFSSAASLLGSPGQGNYAAANAFLDALAHHRQWEGRPALTVNWGSWSEVGMAAASREVAGRQWEALGMGWIDPPRGLRALERLLQGDVAQVAVLPVDWSKFFERVPVATAPRFLEEMAKQSESEALLSGGSSDLLKRLEDAEPGERQEVLLTEIRRQVAEVLGNDPSNLPDPHRPLHELGFDSLAAVELCNALGRALNKHLPPTMLFDYPTLDALSAHLVEDVLRFDSAEESTALESAAAKPPPDEDAGDFRAEALDQVEGLSDEDMESLIAEEIAKLEQQ